MDDVPLRKKVIAAPQVPGFEQAKTPADASTFLQIAAKSKRAPGAAKLTRVAFQTSRLMEFCTERELENQTGHSHWYWLLVIAKELIDNALDGCEEAEVAPVISITVEKDEIVVQDNGIGIDTETIAAILDYSIRVSSREAYVSPTRGAQGNALKTILAMSYVIDRKTSGGAAKGVTVIESRGRKHRVEFCVDHVNNQPRLKHTVRPSPVEAGTKITLHWPPSGTALLEHVASSFRELVSAYVWFNPHLSLRGSWFGKPFLGVKATCPDWEKWRPRQPTSAHWYDEARLQRYLAAHVARDRETGQRRTVREFVAEFRGFAGSAAQRKVLSEVGCSHQSLARFFGAKRVNSAGIAKLLAALCRNSKPVAPKHLGIIGAEHFQTRFLAAGGNGDTFTYQCRQRVTDDGFRTWSSSPSACTRVGLRRMAAPLASCVARPAVSRLSARPAPSWSAPIGAPRSGIRSAPSDARARAWKTRSPRCAPTTTSRSSARCTSLRPACNSPTVARVRSSSLTTRGNPMTEPRPRNIANDIIECVESATAKWTRQKKSEERHPGNIRYRVSRMTKVPRVSQKEVAWEIMEVAYMAASANGTLPASARQIYYQARPKIMAQTDDKELQYNYFSQTLLPDYIEEHGVDWDVVYDARGHFVEPHTNRRIGCGTIEVGNYLRAIKEPSNSPRRFRRRRRRCHRASGQPRRRLVLREGRLCAAVSRRAARRSS